VIVTIDGPAGSGKSTAARGLADRLGFDYIDTGAMYRAVAHSCLAADIDTTDRTSVTEQADRLQIGFAVSAVMFGVAGQPAAALHFELAIKNAADNQPRGVNGETIMDAQFAFEGAGNFGVIDHGRSLEGAAKVDFEIAPAGQIAVDNAFTTRRSQSEISAPFRPISLPTIRSLLSDKNSSDSPASDGA